MTVSRPKKIVSLLFLILGLIVLTTVFFPITLAALKISLDRPPDIADPSGSSGPPAPAVMGILGLVTLDSTRASDWFTKPPDLAPVVSPVRYYTITIPRLNMNAVTVEVNGSDLKKNAIQYPGTSLPGMPGNAVIFGHSALPQFYRPGQPLTIFNPLVKAKEGDLVVVDFDGSTYNYIIQDISEVKPTQVEILNQSYDKKELTLVTCTPLGTFWRRFVARAELVD